MGREARGEQQLSFINIDSPASDSVLTELRQLPMIIDVRQVSL
jgi:hypothetical protein